MIPAHDVTNKVLSRNSSYLVDVVMWPKFVNCNISVREVNIISILYRFNQKKTLFLKGGLGSGLIIWEWH